MKSKYWIIIIVLLILIGAVIFFFFNNNSNQNNQTNYDAQKAQASLNETAKNINLNTNSKNNANNDNSNNNKDEQKELKEEEIATFSTKIVTKDASRQKNIDITCSTLNNTIVENGQTFSFCDTVGQATTDKGYEKAEIFDANGNVKQGLGGGNCQVSTTLYNAVLSVPSLNVTERHAHSNKVPYIETGKDAAVAFGSYDLKFINNSGNSIKITATSTDADITIKLFKLS